MNIIKFLYYKYFIIFFNINNKKTCYIIIIKI